MKLTNPDIAFLNSPGCVLCAYSNEDFRGQLRGSRPSKIYTNAVSDETEPYDPSKNRYVEVVLNWDLKPNTDKYGQNCRGAAHKDRDGDKIDWLKVVKDGASIADNSTLVGSSDGYTVYVTPAEVPDEVCHEDKGTYHFYEFVLAIIEATQEPPEIEKTLPAAPPRSTPVR
jgi:hypothetical protein